MLNLNFYKDRRVMVTGHTGFKGAWLCRMLTLAGAEVIGYSLLPPSEPSLFLLADLGLQMTSILGDVRDLGHLNKLFDSVQPEIVFHLAAQPIVRTGYEQPVYTYETNVIGTVNVLECVRKHPCTKSLLNITTDKVYENREWEWGYRENEPLDGYDPYSNSKSCSELVTHSYKASFFSEGHVAISTARAGNVIGGGDFAKDRIIPDCVRAVQVGKKIIVRNPNSIRPYQHVLEPLVAYLMIAQKQYEDTKYAGWYNVGPDDCDCVSTGKLVNLFCENWGHGVSWQSCSEADSRHEANFLKLDCSKIKSTFGWKPHWHIEEAVKRTCDWTNVWLSGGNVVAEMDRQIADYLEGSE